MFRSFNVVSIRETTLSANQWLDRAERLQFTVETDNKSTISASEDKLTSSDKDEANRLKVDSNSDILPNENFQITLNPMEIRTFAVEMKWKA